MRRAAGSPAWQVGAAMERQRMFAPMRLKIVSSNLHDVIGTETIDPAGTHRRTTAGRSSGVSQHSQPKRRRGMDGEPISAMASLAGARRALERNIRTDGGAVRGGCGRGTSPPSSSAADCNRAIGRRDRLRRLRQIGRWRRARCRSRMPVQMVLAGRTAIRVMPSCASSRRPASRSSSRRSISKTSRPCPRCSPAAANDSVA